MSPAQRWTLGMGEDFPLGLSSEYISATIADLSIAIFIAGLLIKANQINDWSKFEPQGDVSSEIPSGTLASGDEREQNVQFNDAHPGFVDSRGVVNDPLRTNLDDSAISLENFFKRPLKIASVNWTQGGTFTGLTIDPWDLYFTDSRVINRIANFKLMKANLVLKFVLNGNSFFYGRLLISYRPLLALDTIDQYILGDESYQVLASQRPHLYLNPTISQGGMMKLPFFTPLNMLDIVAEDWKQMGKLDIDAPVTLKHANGAAGSVTLSVFCWAEDIHLTGLTQRNPTDIVPQGMEETGIISKPASIVAKTAALFKQVPMISSFATATEIGARAISTMAALFGYSKPVHSDICPLQPLTRQSMAVCDGRENIVKLTVDSCNELTIDPLVASLDANDELTIASIAMRESLLTKFTWGTALDAEALLFNIVVDPCVINQIGSLGNTPMFMPAVAFATFPFEYWKGSLRYRFQVVSSGFHKGRIKIVYDPYGVPQTTGPTALEAEYNVAYTEIVDIAECNDFSITVGWGQSTPFRQHLNFPQNPTTTYRSSNGAQPALPVGLTSSNSIGVGNGTLSVYVVNALTTPNSTVDNDIQVLVSVAACDDFEVAGPSDYYLKRMSPFPITTPPANLIAPQGAEEDILNMGTPVMDTNSIRYMGSNTVLDPLVNRIHMGEAVASFRQLLKRYNLHEAIAYPADDVTSMMVGMTRRMFPFLGGYTTAPTTASTLITTGDDTTGNYVYANLILMQYLSLAYGGWRGSIRYAVDTTFNEVNVGGTTLPFHMSTWEVSRLGNIAERNLSETVDNDTTFSRNFGFGTAYPNNRYVGIKNQSLGLAGSTRWNTVVNPLQSFEVPYYSKYRFCPARQGQKWTTKDVYQDSFSMVTTTAGTDAVSIAYKYVAAGEDFTLMFYLSPPILYPQEPPLPPSGTPPP